MLKSTGGWGSLDMGGTDDYGFRGIPSGQCGFMCGGGGVQAYWWGATETYDDTWNLTHA